MPLDLCFRVKRGESTESFPFGDWHSDQSDWNQRTRRCEVFSLK